MRPVLLLLCGSVAAAMLLYGCASSAIQVPAEVKVEVPVAAIRPQDVPQRPPFRREADLLAMERGRRTLAAWSELEQYWGYVPQLEALVQACSRVPAVQGIGLRLPAAAPP